MPDDDGQIDAQEALTLGAMHDRLCERINALTMSLGNASIRVVANAELRACQVDQLITGAGRALDLVNVANEITQRLLDRASAIQHEDIRRLAAEREEVTVR